MENEKINNELDEPKNKKQKLTENVEKTGEIILLNKPLGWTPLQTIEEYKKENPKQKDKKYGYAGRLDPMARGLLIVLGGDAVKKQKEMELTSKEYIFEVLFGLKTDTFDILGLAPSENYEIPQTSLEEIQKQIAELIPKYIGKRTQQYPPYSSARVKGKPLFQWAREGKLHEVEIPSVEVHIQELQSIESYELTANEANKLFIERINLVTSGDFRQKEIKERWSKILESELNRSKRLPVFKMKAKVTSGTYIRSIANSLGDSICVKEIKVGALALDINRISVGNFRIEEAKNFA